MNASPSALVKLNPFVKNHAGVYQLDLESGVKTTYSDGDLNEQSVMNKLLLSDDVSTYSSELERNWSSWAEEAHLSSHRVNLVAELGIQEKKKVLEIGCGCGALTRYLGEMGLSVDALEMSPYRASITRERCRDLDNVNIFCGNFNDLKLPTEEYDFILLVGVLEYAARFSNLEVEPKKVVNDVLRKCLQSLTASGVIFAAIENRLGLKYVLGACEDHYGVPRIGLYRYPDYESELSRKKSGILTLDYIEWQVLLDSISGVFYDFIFPFPDYKLPEVILSRRFVGNDPLCYQVLYRLRSRDYCSNWSSPIDEYLFWQTAAQSNQLQNYVNSFGIVVGNSKKDVDSCVPFDFVRFANIKRKREYRISTLKSSQGKVVKKLLQKDEASSFGCKKIVKQHLEDSIYIRGKLLSDIWVEALSSLAEVEILTNLLEDYYKYLKARELKNGLSNRDVDVLVFNLIVDEEKQWHIIDVEWEWNNVKPLEAEFVYFRTLLYFSYVHGDAVANCFGNETMVSVKDFVHYGFKQFNIDIDGSIERFKGLEDEFQATVLTDLAYQPTDTILKQPLHMSQRTTLQKSSVSVYWKSTGQSYNNDNSVSREYIISPGIMRIKMRLPALIGEIDGIRIDPVDHRLAAGYRKIELRKMKLVGSKGVIECDTSSDIQYNTNIVGMRSRENHSNEWFVTSIDPQLVVKPKVLKNIGVVSSVELELCWPAKCFQSSTESRIIEENKILMQILDERVG